jgi:hypothetical protein
VDERVGRWIYAIEVLIIGLPTLAMSIPVLLMGLVVVVAVACEVATAPLEALAGLQAGDVGDAAVFVALVAGGVAGITGWFVLSGHYLTDGQKGLRQARPGWWLALIAGVVLVFTVLLAILLNMGWKELAGYRLRWFLGPALVIPATHLIYLRLRSPR